MTRTAPLAGGMRVSVTSHKLLLTRARGTGVQWNSELRQLYHHHRCSDAAAGLQGVLSANGLIEKRPEQPAQQAALVPVPEHFPGMKLGHLLGKGSYGRVFRGTWRGQTIAAKVCSPDATDRDSVPLTPFMELPRYFRL